MGEFFYMWRDEYWNLIFPKNKEDFNFAKALLLKSNYMPKLYKYCKVNESTIDNIINNNVWCRRADLFNDPFDSSVTKNISVHHDKIKEIIIRDFCESFKLEYKLVLEMVKPLSLESTKMALLNTLKVSGVDFPQSQIDSFNETVQGLLDGTIDIFEDYLLRTNEIYQKRVYATCFSENPLSTSMWSHYANDYKGICLEYDFSNLAITNDIFKNIHPVRYTDNPVDLTHYEGKEHVRKTLLAALNKSNDWRYEEEWRIVLENTGSEDEGKCYQVVQPISIIMGSSISEEDKEKILEISSTKNISVKKIRKDRIKNKLSIMNFNQFAIE